MLVAKVARQMLCIIIHAKLWLDIDYELQHVKGSGLEVATNGEVRLVCTYPDGSPVPTIILNLLDPFFHGGLQWKEFA